MSMLYHLALIASSVASYGGPVDIHLPDKEELWIEWVEQQEEAQREEGTRFEDEDGNEVEIG